MNRFEGETVLVTGGNSGIGLATAQAFAAEGARVVITGRDESSLATARASLGKDAIAIRNVTGTVAAARELAQRLNEEGVRLDAMFVNAGIGTFAPFTEMDERAWDDTFSVNVKGPYFQIQALVPLFNEGTSIVLNGSINAHIGMPASSVYAASKAALVSLAKTLSADLLPRGVRVNVVSPGPIATPLHTKLGLVDEAADGLKAQIPLGRFGKSSEVAATVLLLASQDAGFIVGTEVVIDGGMSQL